MSEKKREKHLVLVCFKYCDLYEVEDAKSNEEAEERVRKEIEKEFGQGVIKHMWSTKDVKLLESLN